MKLSWLHSITNLVIKVQPPANAAIQAHSLEYPPPSFHIDLLVHDHDVDSDAASGRVGQRGGRDGGGGQEAVQPLLLRQRPRHRVPPRQRRRGRLDGRGGAPEDP